MAGINVALQLLKKLSRISIGENVSISIIEPNTHYLFKPLMYDLMTECASSAEVCPSYADLLSQYSNIQFIQAYATSIDVSRKTVRYREAGSDDERTSCFDFLCLSLGTQAKTVESISGLTEYSIPFLAVEHVYMLRDCMRKWKTDWKEQIRQEQEEQQNGENRKRAQLDQDRDRDQVRGEGQGERDPLIRIVILGSGFIGVELACNISRALGGGDIDQNQRMCQVTLVNRGSTILRDATSANRARATKSLEDCNVTVLHNTNITSVTNTSVSLSVPVSVSEDKAERSSSNPYFVTAEERVLPADLVLNALGTSPVPIIASLNGGTATAKSTTTDVAVTITVDDDDEEDVAASGTSSWPIHEASGRVLVYDTLQVLNECMPHVFALGDCACVTTNHPLSSHLFPPDFININSTSSGSTSQRTCSRGAGTVSAVVDTSAVAVGVPSSAQVAMQQAYVVADNITSLIKQKCDNSMRIKQQRAQKKKKKKEGSGGGEDELREEVVDYYDSSTLSVFHFLDLGEMLSLGPINATVSLFGGFLGGWVGVWGLLGGVLRRFAYAYRMPTWTQFFIAVWQVTVSLCSHFCGGGGDSRSSSATSSRTD